MSYNNRNQSQDWGQDRYRFNRDDESRNRGNYTGFGSTNYGNDYNQSQGVGADYGNTSKYGAGAFRGGQSSSTGWQNMGNSYGNQYGREGGWNREQGSGYESNYGRQDWGSGNVNTGNYSGYEERNRGGDYGSSSGYGNYGGQERNRYGGENRNFGNSNLRGKINRWLDRAKDEVSFWFNNDDNGRNSSRGNAGHRGKGPSDYRRSEDRIREDVCDRLTDDDRVDASNIRVQVENDVVILSGTVSSREEKHRAINLVESISGVRDVENRIRIGSSESVSDTQSFLSSGEPSITAEERK